ncbi:MAG: hypothetical protein F4X47_13755 [Gammaproteobacteria bacterium]|nr:hypothetical protein [Gammaproteobacteria bacterium]MYC53371.1 hypothetical protein [Gammaproteobacteria bacterium]
MVALAQPGIAIAQIAGIDTAGAVEDTFLDETARRLVVGARHTRDTTRLAIGSYSAVIRERVGFGFPGHQRDRPWASAERAVRVRWSRDEPNLVDILRDRFDNPGPGGRGFPGFFREPGVERFAVDLSGDPFLFGLGPPVGTALGADAVDVADPLGADAEQYYQFRSGDTTRVRLDSGREITTVAVIVIPRYRSIRLVAAILWIDPASMALVRVAYRPAKRVDQEMKRRLVHHGEWRPLAWMDSGGGAPGDDPARGSPNIIELPLNLAFQGLAGRIEMDLFTVIVDLEPWDGRHWLPRAARWKGHFGKEAVTATRRPPPGIPFTVVWTVDLEAVRASGQPAPMPVVTDTQTGGELLPPPVWRNAASVGRQDSPVASDLAAIGIGQGGEAMDHANPWFLRIPGTSVGLMRYTPVEGFSVGGAVRRDFGWWRSELTVRPATKRLALPDLELALQHDHPFRTTRLSFYRALRLGDLGVGAMDGRPGYYVAAEDSVNLHWSHGAMVRLTPGGGRRNRLSLSVFAERDEEIVTGAVRNRVGGALEWKPWWGTFGDQSLGGGANVIVRGSLGDDPHVRSIIESALVIPLAWGFSLGAQAGMAGVWGEPAEQDLWRIATNGSWIRGYRDAVPTPRTWMGRLDLQRSFRFFGLSVYGDWASAEAADYCAVGAGLVLMEGLLRLDVAKGVDCRREGRSEAGWRFQPRSFTFF